MAINTYLSILTLNVNELDFIYLFIHSFMIDRKREVGDTGRGRSRLHAGSPMWDLIPGLQDHTLS